MTRIHDMVQLKKYNVSCSMTKVIRDYRDYRVHYGSYSKSESENTIVARAYNPEYIIIVTCYAHTIIKHSSKCIQ